jgi:hypothetical protein
MKREHNNASKHVISQFSYVINIIYPVTYYQKIICTTWVSDINEK